MSVAYVTSQSSASDIYRIYQDNLMYDLDGSTQSAYAFISACRAIIANPRRVEREAEVAEFDLSLIADQLKRAEAWYRLRSETTGPRQFVPQTDWREDYL